MRLLFDQNLSHRLLAALEDLVPGSLHVRLLGEWQTMTGRHPSLNLSPLICKFLTF